MIVKFVLLLAWASNGTAYTMQEFDSREACHAALAWAVEQGKRRGGLMDGRCINKHTGAQ